ncbi:MAG: hypothetical protein ABTQ34_05200 [Bdellovibrionales bacterium]
MKKIYLAILALSFALVTACSSAPSPLVKPNFALTPRLKLDVATISVVDRSALPTADSTPEAKEFKAMILASVRKWAASNVVPVGTFGEAIVVIRDASLKAQSVAHDDDWFTRPQTTKYIGHVEIEVNVSGVDNVREQATAQAVRYETLPDAPTVDERLGVYYRIIDGLNKDLDTNLGAAMREHLASFILPGAAQLAEGIGKQNVMQTYPTGGRSSPVPGLPYQPINANGNMAPTAPAAASPKQDQLAMQTMQYEASYVPIPPEEIEPSPKSGETQMKNAVSSKQRPTFQPAKAEKPIYVGSHQAQSLGVISKGGASTMVMGQPSSFAPAKNDAAQTASAVGGYGAMPVYQPDQAPTTLRVPHSVKAPVALAPPNRESIAGNVSDLPPTVVVQGSQIKPALHPAAPNDQQPILRAKIVATQPPALPVMPMATNTATSVAPMDSDKTTSQVLSEPQAPEAKESGDEASPAPSRTMTVVGAGGRIRTVTFPATPLPEPRAVGLVPLSQPWPKQEPIAEPPQLAPMVENKPLSPSAEEQNLNMAVKPVEVLDMGKQPPMLQQHVMTQPPVRTIAPRMVPPSVTADVQPTAVAPTQAGYNLAAPAGGSPAAQIVSIPPMTASLPQPRQGEQLYPTVSPASGARPNMAPAPQLQPGEPLYPTARYSAGSQPQPAVAPVSAPQLPEASFPVLSSQIIQQPVANQGAPCPVPASGSVAAYGTNCAAALSSPSSYPSSPFAVE